MVAMKTSQRPRREGRRDDGQDGGGEGAAWGEPRLSAGVLDRLVHGAQGGRHQQKYEGEVLHDEHQQDALQP